MKSITPFTAWLLVVLAGAALLGAAGFGWFILQNAASTSDAIATAQANAKSSAVMARTQALIADTGTERQQLEALFTLDVLTVANEISKTGTDAGVHLDVSNAIPESIGSKRALNGTPVSAIAFTVQAEGSFPALMKTLQLLEDVPLPAEVETFDLSKLSQGKLWQLQGRVRVLTTTSISS